MPHLPHYRAKQVSRQRRRHYEIEGHCYPGVTSILSATKPYEDRQRLWNWQARVGQAQAQQITTKASRAGTRLHKAISAQLQAQPFELPQELEGFWQSVAPLLEKVDEAWLVEGAVWHPLAFAGYPDALMLYEQQLYLCDWKTARRPKKLAWIEDYCLQVAAYCEAVNWVYRDWDVRVEQAMIAIALEDSPAQTFILGPEDLSHYWLAFQKRLEQFYSQL